MRYVLIRDDDANATTQVEQLDLLYRPFIARGLSVNFSIIPEVATHATTKQGACEGFLSGEKAGRRGYEALRADSALVDFIKSERRYEALQHGLSHEARAGTFEFGTADSQELRQRVKRGQEILQSAGLGTPMTFVPPQDHVNRQAMRVLREHFQVVSGGWYNLERVPRRWWPAYLSQCKGKGRRHFVAGGSLFMGHPGCLLSLKSHWTTSVQAMRTEVERSRMTVLLVHHWEFFDNGKPRQKMIDALHEMAAWLGDDDGIEVIRFSQARERLGA